MFIFHAAAPVPLGGTDIDKRIELQKVLKLTFPEQHASIIPFSQKGFNPKQLVSATF